MNIENKHNNGVQYVAFNQDQCNEVMFNDSLIVNLKSLFSLLCLRHNHRIQDFQLRTAKGETKT